LTSVSPPLKPRPYTHTYGQACMSIGYHDTLLIAPLEISVTPMVLTKNM
jgi:hypothetical protein